MPISKENAKLYPSNWQEIRAEILIQAENKCEFCGVPNYALGYRDEEGRFHHCCGNLVCDKAGRGELSYKEAREIADEYNSGWHGDEHKWIVIVLTIAHLDHDPTNNKRTNLAALCQRCHNRWDAKHRQRNRRKKLKLEPLLFDFAKITHINKHEVV